MGTQKINDFESETSFSEDLDEPSLYNVIMLNDHFTTMDFVVEMLVTIFDKSVSESTAIMMNIHNKGKGFCGTYTFDIASSKAEKVHMEAKKKGFPLKCTLEKA